MEKHAEPLMIYLMSAFELSPGDVRLLKFEDIAMKNKQVTINTFKLKSNNKQKNTHIWFSLQENNEISKGSYKK